MKNFRMKVISSTPSKDPFEEEFLRWVNNFFTHQHPRYVPTERVWVPPTDVYETRESIHICMELAGVREEDVEIKLINQYLVVRGKRDDDSRVTKENYYLMEIQYGVFQRVFQLPVPCNPQDITAKLKNGFLNITIKKPQSDSHEYRIQIQ